MHCCNHHPPDRNDHNIRDQTQYRPSLDHAHRLGYEYEWQERFRDIIIRDVEAYIKFTDYIKNNRARWEEDKFNPSKDFPLS